MLRESTRRCRSLGTGFPTRVIIARPSTTVAPSVSARRCHVRSAAPAPNGKPRARALPTSRA